MKILPIAIATASTLITAQSIFPGSTSLATPLDENPTELAQGGIPPATRSVRPITLSLLKLLTVREFSGLTGENH